MSETFGRQVVATAPTGVVAMLGPPLTPSGSSHGFSRDGRQLETVGAPTSPTGQPALAQRRARWRQFRSGEIWTMNLARPVPRRITLKANSRHPIWSPDGSRILDAVSKPRSRAFRSRDHVGGDKRPRNTPTSSRAFAKPMGWTRDGRMVWI